MRLWVDSSESARHIRGLISTPAAAFHVKQKLGEELMETGVEPDMIPVRGDEGRKTGTEGRKYPWGNEFPDETRLDFPIKFKHPVPVDRFPEGATALGVFQMAGNSAEWCADYFDHTSYAKAPPGGVAVDPTGAARAFQPDTWYSGTGTA